MKRILYLIPCIVFSASALAHGGRVDQYGCHHDKKHGGYHCHRGELAGMRFADKDEMLAFLAKEPSQSSTGQDSQQPASPTTSKQKK